MRKTRAACSYTAAVSRGQPPLHAQLGWNFGCLSCVFFVREPCPAIFTDCGFEAVAPPTRRAPPPHQHRHRHGGNRADNTKHDNQIHARCHEYTAYKLAASPAPGLYPDYTWGCIVFKLLSRISLRSPATWAGSKPVRKPPVPSRMNPGIARILRPTRAPDCSRTDCSRACAHTA